MGVISSYPLASSVGDNDLLLVDIYNAPGSYTTKIAKRSTVLSGSLPDMAGHSGEFLTNNGSAASWAPVSELTGIYFASQNGVTLDADLGDVTVGTDSSVAMQALCDLVGAAGGIIVIDGALKCGDVRVSSNTTIMGLGPCQSWFGVGDAPTIGVIQKTRSQAVFTNKHPKSNWNNGAPVSDYSLVEDCNICIRDLFINGNFIKGTTNSANNGQGDSGSTGLYTNWADEWSSTGGWFIYTLDFNGVRNLRIENCWFYDYVYGAYHASYVDALTVKNIVCYSLNPNYSYVRTSNCADVRGPIRNYMLDGMVSWNTDDTIYINSDQTSAFLPNDNYRARVNAGDITGVRVSNTIHYDTNGPAAVIYCGSERGQHRVDDVVFSNITSPTMVWGESFGGSAAVSAVVAAGGSGHALNDVLTVSGGTVTFAAKFRVTGVSGGAVTTVALQNGGYYGATPSNPAATTSSGAGTGCTLTVTYQSGGGGNVGTVTYRDCHFTGSKAFLTQQNLRVQNVIFDGVVLDKVPSSVPHGTAGMFETRNGSIIDNLELRNVEIRDAGPTGGVLLYVEDARTVVLRNVTWDRSKTMSAGAASIAGSVLQLIGGSTGKITLSGISTNYVSNIVRMSNAQVLSNMDLSGIQHSWSANNPMMLVDDASCYAGKIRAVGSWAALTNRPTTVSDDLRQGSQEFTTQVYDRFVGSDGTNLTAHTADVPASGSWGAAVGTIGIVSNQAKVTATGAGSVGLYTYDAGTADYMLSAVMNSGTTVQSLIFRYTDSSNFWRLQKNGDGTVTIYERVSGSDTDRGTITVPTIGASFLCSVLVQGTRATGLIHSGADQNIYRVTFSPMATGAGTTVVGIRGQINATWGNLVVAKP